MRHDARVELRRAVLAECGAGPESVERLLDYNDTPFEAAQLQDRDWPLADEPHLAAWDEYARDAASMGAIPALRGRLVQLLFPVEAGISAREDYRAATRKGHAPDAAPGPALVDPGGVRLEVHPTLAGRVPILVVSAREDFVTLVQVFSARNEPVHVPDSMGACIVTGLNNWDRVRRYRAAFESARGGPADEIEWTAEFRARLAPRPELYQDRFILLSSGPYSGVPAAALGLDEGSWRQRSLAIRREHECTHYLTYRAFGRMRNNALDELIADFAALALVDGHYDAELALRFLGLEDFPRWREGGRLQSYLGDPPLGEDAVAVLRALVFRAVRNLAQVVSERPPRGRAAIARHALALAGLTLEELASHEMAARFADALQAVPRLDAEGR